jgi:tryptophan synthase alpha chain
VTKLLMPYITAGVGPDWAAYLTAFEDAGADLIEVGLPFSDPTVDGPTIQQASDNALARGATPSSVLAELASIRVGPRSSRARTPTSRSGRASPTPCAPPGSAG